MPELNSVTFQRFDTLCTIQADVEQTVFDQVVQLCNHFDLLLSRFNPESTLYKLNSARGAWVQVGAELAQAVTKALEYCQATQGLFDVTMGGVCALWDFKAGTVPSPEAIAQAHAHVNWRNVEVMDDWVRIADPEAMMDLGGVAKGMIADAIVALLVECGATTGFLNLGGNVVVIGSKPDGQPWHVGLRAPAPSSGSLDAPSFAVVSVQGKSVVTSGIYERAFVSDGCLLHHILSPLTGAPAVTDVLSVTVISDKSVDADGYTTALIIMGAERALAFVEALSGIEAIILTASGEVLRTSGVLGTDNHFRVQ